MTSKTKRIRRIILIFIIFSMAFLTLLGLYSLSLSLLIETRFSGRRWQIPSRVFSDTTLLYPGQRLNPESLREKLLRLQYREVLGPPEKKGEMQSASGHFDIFLNDVQLKAGKRDGFLVRIQHQNSIIEAMVRLDTGESLPILEIEPEELALFFGPEREKRQLVSIQHVPDHLIRAVIAVEDSRFYEHHGISPLGILRATYMNLRYGRIKQGGSTITQQLAKNYFLTPERTITRKLKEILIALILEVKYEKSDILEIYFNEIYFGQKGSVSINGVGEASFFYFGKSVEKLNLLESALIAGLIKGPNIYSPYVDMEACRARRNSVLKAMLKEGWLSAGELRSLAVEPVRTSGFRIAPRKAPYFIDYLYKQLNTLYSKEDLSSLGLSIYTTLDTQVQQAAEQALETGLRRLENARPELNRAQPEKKLQGAIVVIQPKTGYILAMVGGRDYNHSQFNRISQARRQTGSAFKPFVFLSALDRFTPASMFSNAPTSYPTAEGEWIPQNFKPTPDAPVSMRTALAHSHNRATVDLAMQIGLDRIIHTARSFHFSTPVSPYPSLALGAFEAIPLELARAYCVFAADGVQPYPLSLKNVTDRDNIVLNRRHMQIERLISPAKAFIISSMLKSAVVEGTGRSLARLGATFPAAGKTGTTNSYRDAWFVGYTPDILALVWIGFDNGDSIYSTGSSAALPVWAGLMKAIPQHISETWFHVPPGVVKKKICPVSGMLRLKLSCPETAEEYFLEENVPDTRCDIHSLQIFKNLLKGIKDVVR